MYQAATTWNASGYRDTMIQSGSHFPFHQELTQNYLGVSTYPGQYSALEETSQKREARNEFPPRSLGAILSTWDSLPQYQISVLAFNESLNFTLKVIPLQITPQTIKVMQLLWFLKKLNMESLHDSAILLLGIESRAASVVLKRYLYTHVHGGIIHKSPKTEKIQMPIDGWMMDKWDVVGAHLLPSSPLLSWNICGRMAKRKEAYLVHGPRGTGTGHHIAWLWWRHQNGKRTAGPEITLQDRQLRRLRSSRLALSQQPSHENKLRGPTKYLSPFWGHSPNDLRTLH